MRVLIVDDSDAFRARVKRHLDPEPGIDVVGEARDGVEALAAIGTLRPELVLLDLHMPNGDGFSVLREAKERFVAMKIVVLTLDASPAVRERCAMLRAEAVIAKADAAAEILPTLRVLASPVR